VSVVGGVTEYNNSCMCSFGLVCMRERVFALVRVGIFLQVCIRVDFAIRLPLP